MITLRCYASPPYIINRAGYKKAKRLYNRKLGSPICYVKDCEIINDFLLVPPDSDWRRYKDRILIFRPGYKIASFVITPNHVYCPIAVCCEQCGEDDYSFSVYFVYKKIRHKTYYWKDMKTYKCKIQYKKSKYIRRLQNSLKRNKLDFVISFI